MRRILRRGAIVFFLMVAAAGCGLFVTDRMTVSSGDRRQQAEEQIKRENERRQAGPPSEQSDWDDFWNSRP